MSSTNVNSQRLFLALWPGETERTRLAKIAQTVTGGRQVKPANLHLTLVFLGATNAQQLFSYQEALRGIEVPAVILILDRLGYWPKSRILWLGAGHTPPTLQALVTDLNRRLQGCGFTPERRPFRAHVTLARKFPGPAPTDATPEPLCWSVNRIALVESLNSRDGVHYEIIGRWPASGT